MLDLEMLQRRLRAHGWILLEHQSHEKSNKSLASRHELVFEQISPKDVNEVQNTPKRLSIYISTRTTPQRDTVNLYIEVCNMDGYIIRSLNSFLNLDLSYTHIVKALECLFILQPRRSK
jgi:hypothetical protein